GGKRRLTVDRVEFAGYGLDAPVAGHSDYRGKDVKDAAVVWLGSTGPKGLDQTYRRLLMGRNRYATEQLGAAVAIGPVAAAGGAGRGGRGSGPGASAAAGRAEEPPEAGGGGPGAAAGAAGLWGRAPPPAGAVTAGAAAR